MPLPRENSRWPLPELAPAFDRYRFDEALWLNDTDTLRAMLAGGSPNTADDYRHRAIARRGSILNLDRRWHVAAQVPQGEKRTTLPVPIGANLASLSAGQLMAEPPAFRLITQGENGPERVKGAQQDRLDVIANSADAHMTLLEGAQITAALGDAVLKAVWDKSDPDRLAPWFDVVGGDCALPEFNSAGRLVAVTLFQEYADGDNRVLRHFERHASGGIEHALYRGTNISVGRIVPLGTVETLQPIAALPGTITDGLVVIIPTGTARLTAAFWRNRPSKAWRRSGQLANLGRSDFEGIEPLLDAYSEAWGSMMRDVRLGKARAIIPRALLEGLGGGQGAIFDADREFFQQVDTLEDDGGQNHAQMLQAEIRWEEHKQTLRGLRQELLDATGWAAASYGSDGGDAGQGGGVTATEVTDRARKSETTRDEKALYFNQPANPFMRTLLELDAVLYPGQGSTVQPVELRIDFPDVSQVDPEKQARQFADLRNVDAISIEQTIRERRPNWDDDEVQTELDRIFAEKQRVEGSLSDDPAATAGREQITLRDPADDDTGPDAQAQRDAEPARA